MHRYTLAEFAATLFLALAAVIVGYSWFKGQTIAATIFY